MPHEVWEEGVQNGDRVPSGNRVSVYEAAEVLGDTEDPKSERIQRGTIPHERDDSRALLDASSIVPDGRGDYRTAPDKLREQIRYLREILSEERDARRRVDTIIAQLTHERRPRRPRSRAGTPRRASGCSSASGGSSG
jgi:hypothetical protein